MFGLPVKIDSCQNTALYFLNYEMIILKPLYIQI